MRERAKQELDRIERELPSRRAAALTSLRARASKMAFRVLTISTVAEEWEPVDIPGTDSDGVLLERDGLQFIYTERRGLGLIHGNEVHHLETFHDFVLAYEAVEAAEAAERPAPQEG